MGVINPWLDCLSNISQVTRMIVRLHFRWMTRREINRCDDELAFAKDYDSLKAHMDFLNRTLNYVRIRRFILFWPFWFLYKAVEPFYNYTSIEKDTR